MKLSEDRYSSKALAKRLDFSLQFLLDKKSSCLATLLTESSGVEWSRVESSGVDLCQQNRAKELLLSENRLVWPPCRGSRMKTCAVASHWGGGGQIFVMVNILS